LVLGYSNLQWYSLDMDLITRSGIKIYVPINEFPLLIASGKQKRGNRVLFSLVTKQIGGRSLRPYLITLKNWSEYLVSFPTR
jgi:hypothetical protein